MFDKIKNILETYPTTRGNDHELYVRYFEEILGLPFDKNTFMSYEQSFESISRARRKIQERFPQLKDEKTAKRRRCLEKQYRRTYKNRLTI